MTAVTTALVATMPVRFTPTAPSSEIATTIQATATIRSQHDRRRAQAEHAADEHVEQQDGRDVDQRGGDEQQPDEARRADTRRRRSRSRA